jgi:catechol 2,3-dioxygenase-like lactoylglutathione lyase family enzyme
MRPQPLIAVTDVDASRRWYRRLFALDSNEGNQEYARLFYNGRLILQLHAFEAEHDHGPIGNRDDKPYGNGLLLWFEVDDFDAVMQRATEMAVEIVLPRHRNPRPNHWECWIRDPDGYIVVVASADDTALSG